MNPTWTWAAPGLNSIWTRPEPAIPGRDDKALNLREGHNGNNGYHVDSAAKPPVHAGEQIIESVLLK